MFELGDIVCFKAKHKWAGCLGFVEKIKQIKGEETMIMVGVPIPMKGIAYIYVMPDEIENLNCAYMYPGEIDGKYFGDRYLRRSERL